MYLKDHIVRIENMKALQALHEAHLDHRVIALFMTTEGIEMQAAEVSTLLNTYDPLGAKKIPSKKIQALINAKHLAEEDDSLPCPASY